MKSVLTWLGTGICVLSFALLIVSVMSGCTPKEVAMPKNDPGVEGEYGSVLEGNYSVDEGIKIPMEGATDEDEENTEGAEEGSELDKSLEPGELGEVTLIPVDGDGRPLDGSAPPEIAAVRRPEDLEGFGTTFEEREGPYIEEYYDPESAEALKTAQ